MALNVICANSISLIGSKIHIFSLQTSDSQYNNFAGILKELAPLLSSAAWAWLMPCNLL